MMNRFYLTLALVATATAHGQVLREDWKEIPWALPVTQEHVANPMLNLELHGPGLKGIKKSNHDHIKNDPFYIWSGKCERNWALSLSHKKSLIDLSAADAKVRWRSRQSGKEHQLHLILRLPGDRWIVSEECDGLSEDWHEFEFDISKLNWRHLDIITVTAGEQLEAPKLNRVDAIGFTDLRPGNGSKQCSRLDWIEVHGKTIDRPARKAPAVKTSRVQPQLPSGVAELLGLRFAKYGKRELKLDLYTPKEKSDEPRPAIIFIHAGGWDKDDPSATSTGRLGRPILPSRK
jgi:hypothetical protein